MFFICPLDLRLRKEVVKMVLSPGEVGNLVLDESAEVDKLEGTIDEQLHRYSGKKKVFIPVTLQVIGNSRIRGELFTRLEKSGWRVRGVAKSFWEKSSITFYPQEGLAIIKS